VVGYKEFDPYGNPIVNRQSEIVNRYAFSGEWWEDEVGLLYLRARWYMPGTGTFLSRDPVESEPPYAYVRGNVVNAVDPSGMQANESVCDSWSFPFKKDCISMENGNLLMTEIFYRTIPMAYLKRMVGFYVSADLLEHYLDGTTTPGEPYYIYDREWILSTREDRNARRTLISYFINEYIKPAIDSCSNGLLYRRTLANRQR